MRSRVIAMTASAGSKLLIRRPFLMAGRVWVTSDSPHSDG
jgi:hypothetical protein